MISWAMSGTGTAPIPESYRSGAAPLRQALLSPRSESDRGTRRDLEGYPECRGEASGAAVRAMQGVQVRGPRREIDHPRHAACRIRTGMMKEVMGTLVDGEWQDAGYETSLTGHFERRPTTFRNWVTADGSPGPTGSGEVRCAAK